MTAVFFGALALVLTGPVPSYLARTRWPMASPRAAIVLWQSVALAAILSAFSCGLAIASNLLVIGPNGRLATNPFDEISTLGWVRWLLYVAVFGLTLLVGARLLYTTLRVGARTRARRSQHRQVVDIVDNAVARRHLDASSHPLGGKDIRMLDVDEPLAYCLPGLRGRVVLSAGTVAALTATQLHAVLAHERAHLRARHDLVLEAFIALHEAFPRFVRSKSALGQVELLVEMLADDRAVHTVGRTPLAGALVACAGGKAPAGALAVGGPSTLLRVRRLADDPAPWGSTAVAYLAALLILMGPTLAVALPWLRELSRLLGGA